MWKVNGTAMRLSELTQPIGIVEAFGSGDPDITSVEYDSRRVTPGSLFVAIRGAASDGNRFLGDAASRGAVAAVTDCPGMRAGIPLLRVGDARKALALLSDRFFGSPQHALMMVGITGTNGKTTTAHMVQSIIESSGMRCGLMGTISHQVGGTVRESLNTTPESRDIHRMLAEMAAAGQHACVMEVSSHALALSRVHGIRFRAVAFTNLTRDHLDFHGDIDRYLDAKSILFSTLSGDSTAVVNLDDPAAGHIMSVSRGGKVITAGFGETADIHPAIFRMFPDGTELSLATPSGALDCRLPIPGAYNVLNAMIAAGLGLACGLTIPVIAKGLAGMRPVRGRFELVREGQPFTVVVDYAHTPDALERVLNSAREITGGRLIAVFGCGGDRDRGKRPQMGNIAGRLANFTIITSDNPRTENPESIIREVAAGVPDTASFVTCSDRNEAIGRALDDARPGDTVVIAGKGHEDYQIIGTTKIHFDDAEIVRGFLKDKGWKDIQCNG
jgi:UDP-N-acetylmuramoyl-L-alanyl-D-glutamate--2,6-diaminopimelate ligase